MKVLFTFMWMEKAHFRRRFSSILRASRQIANLLVGLEWPYERQLYVIHWLLSLECLLHRCAKCTFELKYLTCEPVLCPDWGEVQAISTAEISNWSIINWSLSIVTIMYFQKCTPTTVLLSVYTYTTRPQSKIFFHLKVISKLCVKFCDNNKISLRQSLDPTAFVLQISIENIDWNFTS